MSNINRLVLDAEYKGVRYSAETYVPHELIKWTKKPLEVDKEFWPNIKSLLKKKLDSSYGHPNYNIVRFRLVADNMGIPVAEEVKWK